jgi:hypothetical protein
VERDGEDRGGQDSSGDINAVRYRGGRTAMMSTATALARARGHVWRVGGIGAQLWARGESERWAE